MVLNITPPPKAAMYNIAMRTGQGFGYVQMAKSYDLRQR